MTQKPFIVCILFAAVFQLILFFKLSAIDSSITALSIDQQTQYANLNTRTTELWSRIDSRMNVQFEENSRRLAEFAEDQLLFRSQMAGLEKRITADMVAIKMQQRSLALAVRESSGVSTPGQEFLQTMVDDGILLFNDKEFILCASTMSDVLSIAPASIPAQLYLNASLFYANPMDSTNYKRVAASMGAVLAADPANPLALKVLAEVSVEQQEWEAAYRYYRRLRDLDPDSIEYLDKLVTVCMQMGDLPRAEYEMVLLRRKDPDNYLYLYYTALLKEQREDNLEAFELFSQSMEINPEHRPSLLGAARTAILLENYADAEGILTSKSLQGSYEVLKLLSDCYLKQNMIQQAVHTREQSLKTLNLQTREDLIKAADCCCFVAQIYYSKGTSEDAWRYVNTGLGYYRSNALLLIKSRLLLDGGKNSEARTILSGILDSSAESDSDEVVQVQELLQLTGAAVHG